jgi:hypothetical protein
VLFTKYCYGVPVNEDGITCIGEMKNIYNILVRNPEAKRQLMRLKT